MKISKTIYLMLSMAMMIIFIGCGEDDSDSNTIKIYHAPTAHAGKDQSVNINEVVTLKGTGKVGDGVSVSYEWQKDNKVVAETSLYTYVPKKVGKDIFTFVVTDNRGIDNSDSVVITVNNISSENQAPKADAGEDKSVIVNNSITLTGTASDSDGSISSYEWKKGNITLATTVTFNYLPTIIGTDTLTFVVTDNDGAVDSDTIVITVQKENEIKNEIFIDSTTGLEWQDNKDAGAYGDEPSKNWENAKTYCSTLSLSTYSDWHLPTIDELKSISANNSSFTNSSYGFYWSFTTDNSSSRYNALGIYFANNSGTQYSFNKNDEYKVRCVRGKSKQNDSESENNSSRFIREYKMVSDNSTKLQWQDNRYTSLLGFKNWNGAVNYCNSLTLGGYNDWYLPKLEELKSIVDKSRPSTYPMIDSIFENIFPTDYWTSTNDSSSDSNAWCVTFNSYSDGNSRVAKDYTRSVRCVRSLQE